MFASSSAALTQKMREEKLEEIKEQPSISKVFPAEKGNALVKYDNDTIKKINSLTLKSVLTFSDLGSLKNAALLSLSSNEFIIYGQMGSYPLLATISDARVRDISLDYKHLKVAKPDERNPLNFKKARLIEPDNKLVVELNQPSSNKLFVFERIGFKYQLIETFNIKKITDWITINEYLITLSLIDSKINIKYYVLNRNKLVQVDEKLCDLREKTTYQWWLSDLDAFPDLSLAVFTMAEQYVDRSGGKRGCYTTYMIDTRKSVEWAPGEFLKPIPHGQDACRVLKLPRGGDFLFWMKSPQDASHKSFRIWNHVTGQSELVPEGFNVDYDSITRTKDGVLICVKDNKLVAFQLPPLSAQSKFEKNPSAAPDAKALVSLDVTAKGDVDYTDPDQVSSFDELVPSRDFSCR